VQLIKNEISIKTRREEQERGKKGKMKGRGRKKREGRKGNIKKGEGLVWGSHNRYFFV